MKTTPPADTCTRSPTVAGTICSANARAADSSQPPRAEEDFFALPFGHAVARNLHVLNHETAGQNALDLGPRGVEGRTALATMVIEERQQVSVWAQHVLDHVRPLAAPSRIDRAEAAVLDGKIVACFVGVAESEQVGVAPFDAFVEPCAFGQPARFVERDIGEIDRDHFLPAELREQARFVAATAAQYDCVASARRAFPRDACKRRRRLAELEFVRPVSIDGIPESGIADGGKSAVHEASIPYANGGQSDGSSEDGRACVSPSMNVEKYIEASEKLNLEGLDLSAAAEAGLSDDERFILTYFADIESQTIIYLRDLLRTDAALEPEVTGFLAAWNYEEYFHGRAISRLLAACGVPPASPAAVRGLARFSEKVEAFGGSLLSRFFRRQFPALYMTWGAINELTTLRGYERIAATTRNPVLRELCLRIAKQERRHFAFYFSGARQRLASSRVARWLTRNVLRRFWSPVGAGVKSATEVARLVSSLFPGEAAGTLAESVDRRIAKLPGLDGIDLMTRYTRSLAGGAKLLPWSSARITA